MFHRHCVASQVYKWVDAQLFHYVWHWARRRHPDKRCDWTKRRYFRTLGKRDWVFMPPGKESEPLFSASSVPIVRHVKIKQHARPFHPEWDPYLAARKLASKAPECAESILVDPLLKPDVSW